MSSLYRRRLKAGVIWYANVRLRDGTRKNFCTGARTKPAALEVLRTVESEIAAGRDPWRKGCGRLLSEVVPIYLSACEQRLRANTIRSYRLTLDQLRERAGDIPVISIDREAVDSFRLSMAGRGRATVNIHLTNLRAFLRWYRRECEANWQPPRIDLMRADPVTAVDYYNAEERQRILVAAANVWVTDKHQRPAFPFFNFVAALLFTGMRKAECIALHWSPPLSDRIAWPWIDLQQGQVVVPAAFAKGRRNRFIPIMPEFRRILGSWPGVREGRLFPFTSGGGWIGTKWTEVCRRAGVRRLKIHNLRDTYAVSLLMAGVPWAVVGEVLGHQSVETTRRYYAAIGREDLQAAIGGLSIANLPDILPTLVK